LHEFDGDAKNSQCSSEGQGHRSQHEGLSSRTTSLVYSLCIQFVKPLLQIQTFCRTNLADNFFDSPFCTVLIS